MTPNFANKTSNMEKGRQEFSLQDEEFYNSEKVRKVVAIYKTKKCVCPQKLEARKKNLTQKVVVPDLFSVTN